MAFIHDDPEFDDLLRIVAERRGLSIGVVEKDYWVTHTLVGDPTPEVRGVVQGRHVPLEGVRPH